MGNMSSINTSGSTVTNLKSAEAAPQLHVIILPIISDLCKEALTIENVTLTCRLVRVNEQLHFNKEASLRSSPSLLPSLTDTK